MNTLDQQAIGEALSSLNGWGQKENAIEKSFEFKDFSEATGFLMRVAMISEKRNHHAEYSGVYNKLRLSLSSHDAGGITDRDIRMAADVDKLLG